MKKPDDFGMIRIHIVLWFFLMFAYALNMVSTEKLQTMLLLYIAIMLDAFYFMLKNKKRQP